MRTLILLVIGLCLMACAKAATLKEEQPVASGLGKYASVAVETKLQREAEKEANGYDGRLTEMVIEQLKGKNVFGKIEKASAGPGDLVIRMTITNASKGSSLNQLVGTGNDATVDVVVEVMDKDSKALGKFSVHADSSRSSSTSVNGVDTQTGSNPLSRAVDSAAAEIGQYIAARK
jgi:hypothetical protein